MSNIQGDHFFSSTRLASATAYRNEPVAYDTCSSPSGAALGLGISDAVANGTDTSKISSDTTQQEPGNQGEHNEREESA